MNKNTILSAAAGLMLSLGVLATGCGDDSMQGSNDMATNVPGQDLSMPGPGQDGGGQPSCVANPVTDTDFLNSCPPGNVVSVTITPNFPDKAPGGVLPSLP
jgi:hypothetical protein